MTAANANELVLYGGGLYGGRSTEATYSWALEYRRPLDDHFSASFTWLNEGHLPDHHRDGQAVQLWWHHRPPGRGTVFEIGLGPYRYFDTATAANSDGYANMHGWGLLASAGATWYYGREWFGTLRINRVQARNSFSTTSLVAGLGYRFGPGGESAPAAPATSRATTDGRRWEIDAMAGIAVANDFESENELANGVALRYRASQHITGSLTYLDEGDAWGDRRNGVAAQLWLEDDLTDRLSVGVGLGPYVLFDRPRKPDGEDFARVSALLSVTAAYAISPSWTGRLIWNRVATSYDRDSDVVLLAVGYRF
jgi:hypothetical protein